MADALDFSIRTLGEALAPPGPADTSGYDQAARIYAQPLRLPPAPAAADTEPMRLEPTANAAGQMVDVPTWNEYAAKMGYSALSVDGKNAVRDKYQKDFLPLAIKGMGLTDQAAAELKTGFKQAVPATKPIERSIPEAIADFGKQTSTSLGAIISNTIKLFEPGNKFAAELDASAKDLKATMSPKIKDAELHLQELQRDAPPGLWDQFVATIKGIVSNPTLVSDRTAQAAANIVPMIMGGGVVAGPLRLAGAGSKAVSTAELLGGAASAGVQEAGDTRNQVYDQLRAVKPEDWAKNDPAYNNLRAAGVSEADAIAKRAEQLSLNPALISGIFGAAEGLVGFTAAKKGLEQALVKNLPAPVRGATAVGTELAKEIAQEEYTQYAGNAAAGAIDKKTEPTAGMGAVAGETLAQTLPFAGHAGLHAMQAHPEPAVTPPAVAPTPASVAPNAAPVPPPAGSVAPNGPVVSPEPWVTAQGQLPAPKIVVDELVDDRQPATAALPGPAAVPALPAPPAPAHPPIVVDAAGNAVRVPAGAERELAQQRADLAAQRQASGFTPDVQRAQMQRTEVRPPAAAPAAEPPAPAETQTVGGKAVVLQNRDRSSLASVEQMNKIAADPDPDRLGFSRDFGSGAPVVFANDDQVPVGAQQLGRDERAKTAEGREIPVKYAVVEASSLLASHSADGSPVTEYDQGATDKLRAVAGNGRIAGIQAAYQRGTADRYRQGIIADAGLTGVDPHVVAAMREPVLVRIMPAAKITPTIGDESNVSGTSELSVIEQAKTDGARLDLAGLEFGEDGGATPKTLTGFIAAMPQAERPNLVSAHGEPTRQAHDRLMAAVFLEAYGNPELVRLYAQATDPEARNVLSGLASAATQMVRLKDAGDLDVRSLVAQAAGVAVRARREGVKIDMAARQMDLGHDPTVNVLVSIFAEHSRSPKRIGAALRDIAQAAYNESTKSDAPDMFGEVEPRRAVPAIVEGAKNAAQQQREENLGQPAGRVADEGVGYQVAADRGKPANGQAAQGRAGAGAASDTGPAGKSGKTETVDRAGVRTERSEQGGARSGSDAAERGRVPAAGPAVGAAGSPRGYRLSESARQDVRQPGNAPGSGPAHEDQQRRIAGAPDAGRRSFIVGTAAALAAPNARAGSALGRAQPLDEAALRENVPLAAQKILSGAADRSGAPAGRPTGLITPGNIDLSKRPTVKNADGSISTVRSMSFEVGGKEVLVPTVSADGRIMTDDQAVAAYRRTHLHLGIFDTPAHATAYAERLHQAQAEAYLPGNATHIDGAQRLRDVMKIIAADGPPSVRELAAKIGALLPAKGLMLTVDTTPNSADHGNVELRPTPHMHLYIAPGRTGFSYSTVLHESLHAAVAARYFALNIKSSRANEARLGIARPGASPKIDQFVNVWYEYRDSFYLTPAFAQTDAGFSAMEALSDPDEFFVRALTDPAFQAHLATMEYKGKTLWERFKDWVKTSLLGIRETGTRASWLDAALLASNELVDAMPADAASFNTLHRVNDRATTTEAKRSAVRPEPADPKVAAGISRLLTLAKAGGNANLTVKVAPVSDGQANLIAQHTGVDVAGYEHSIDMYAVRHTLGRHGEAAVESSRGQLPLRREDIEAIPSVVTSPDAALLGMTNPRGQQNIGWIKRMPDGTVLVVEEIREGRRTLAMASARKYPAASDFSTIADRALPTYAQSDGGDKAILVELDANGNAVGRAPDTAPGGVQEQGAHAYGQQQLNFDQTGYHGDLFGDLETRPDAKPSVIKKGVDALEALAARREAMPSGQRSLFDEKPAAARPTNKGFPLNWADQGRASLLANTMTRDFVERGATKLIDQKVSSPGDLAALAQVYRDPRFETFRMFYVKGDQIVHQTGITSRLPSMAKVVPDGMNGQQWAADVARTMKQYAADGYYMLHNHPSGNPDPSQADYNLTHSLSRRVAGFKGHVIIDTNTYTVINQEGAKIERQDFGGYDPNKNPILAGPGYGQIRGIGDLARLGKTIQRPGYVTILGTDTNMNVRVAIEFPKDMIDASTKLGMLRATARIRRAAIATGAGGYMFAVGDIPAKSVIPLLLGGVLSDAVVTDPAGENHGDLRSLRAIGLQPNYEKSQLGRARTPTFAVEQQVEPYTLDSLARTLATGKLQSPNSFGDRWKSAKDAIATAVADATIPFQRFVQGLPIPQANVNAILRTFDLAPGRRAEFEKRMSERYGVDISKAVKRIASTAKMDFDAAKEVAGRWMAAKYAAEANAWLMHKDQDAVDEADAMLNQALLQNQAAQSAGGVLPHETREINRLQAELTKQQAQQANRIAEIQGPVRDPQTNPYKVGVAGGLNNATAAKVIADIEAKIPAPLLDAAATPVYGMLKAKLDQDLVDGKVTQAQVDAWPQSPRYVPLTGDPRALSDVAGDEGVFATGSVNQGKDRGIAGRKTGIAQNAIDAAFEAVEKSANFHGWAGFKTAFNDAYMEQYHMLIGAGRSPMEAKHELADTLGISMQAENAMSPAGPHSIIVRMHGEPGVVYTINDSNALAALQSLNKEPIPSAMKIVAVPTRLFARLVTQFMPGFAPINAIRDVWEKSENIRARVIPGVNMDRAARAAITNALNPAVMAATFRVAFAGGKPILNPSNSYERDLLELIEQGGIATWGEFLNRQKAELTKQLKGFSSLSKTAMHGVETYNNGFEMISSLAVYRALKDQGVEAEAAAHATVSLMNFRKGGAIMGPVRALYMFAQPIITGTAQLTQTLGTRTGQVRLAAYIGIGMLLYAMAREGQDDDETGRNRVDELGNFVLERSIPIPWGDSFIKVPVGFGLPQVGWGIAFNLVKYLNGSQSGADTIGEIMKIGVKQASPVAPSEAPIGDQPAVWLAQSLTPQMLKPITNIALDRNVFGSPLTSSKYVKLGEPHSEHGRPTTAPEWKDAAIWLAQKTGVDLYPEQLKELANGYVAGPLREALTATIENPNSDRLGRNYPVQALNRWYGEFQDDFMRERVYRRIENDAEQVARQVTLANQQDEEPGEKNAATAELFKEMTKLDARISGRISAATKKLKTDPEALNERRQEIYKEAEPERGRLIKRYFAIQQGQQ